MIEDLPKSNKVKVEEVSEEKKPNYLFDFLYDISSKKRYIYDETTQKAYNKYMLNRYLSMHESTVLYAQEMNIRPNIDGQLHYDYLMAAIRPSYRKFDYKKAAKVHEDVILLSEYFDCSLKKAQEYLKILSLEELQDIQVAMNKGGDVKSKSQKIRTK